MTATTDASPLDQATSSDLALAPGTYELDLNHSGVYFQIRHLGLSNVRGTFKQFDATMTIGASLDDSTVEATVDLASVDTNQPDRDVHLRSTDFFHADEHPQMSFRSTRISNVGGDEYELEGEL